MGINDIVIIGGGACGPKTAARVRRLDQRARITIIQEEELISYAGCGLPYYISGAVDSTDVLLVRDAEAFKKISNTDVLLNTRVVNIDRSRHKIDTVNCNSGEKGALNYSKLVISTGARPLVPAIQGIELNGVNVLKRVSDAEEITRMMGQCRRKKATIIGAGLVGMEMAEALVSRGFEVTIVEAMNTVLPALLDEEISCLLVNELKNKGITIKLAQKVTRFEGENGSLRRLYTETEEIDTEIAIVAIGVRPDVSLAKEAGLQIGPFGDIVVNECLQTSDPDIYAGGDCVANVSIVDGHKTFAPMGSTANKHGHVIAANVTGGTETFPGIVSTACARVFELNVGRVGLGEEQAIRAGYKVTTAIVPGLDKPRYFPTSQEIILKLIVDANTGRIVGGQGIGQGDVIKRIDVLATGITLGITVDSLKDLDIAYAPPYNTALDVLHHAANLVCNKLNGRTEGMTPTQVKKKIADEEDFILLDVRNRPEWDCVRVEAPQVSLLSLPELYERMSTLPKGKEIVVMCQRGGRAYQAACTLRGNGFGDVKFMEGSLSCWCDGLKCIQDHS